MSASQLLKQKEILSSQEFSHKMEDILQNLAKISNEEAFGIPNEIGLLEKMSFEIRTPMNSILGFTGLLKDSYFTIQEKDEFIDLIEKNTEQLIELLNDLTDLTKIENLQINLRMEKFELNVFLLQILSEFNHTFKDKQIELTKNTHKNLPQDVCVYTDPYQLKKIIQILLSNLARLNDSLNIELASNILNDENLEIRIISNQLELPETISRSIKKHITSIEGQTNFDGTGLKLTITKALVDLLNGEIEFVSDHEHGSEFIVRIPIKVCKI
jgi:signal transduction histidine kinase